MPAENKEAFALIVTNCNYTSQPMLAKSNEKRNETANAKRIALNKKLRRLTMTAVLTF